MLDTIITLDDLNEAILLNPRNAYQKYAAATNSSKRVLNTYMGELLPNLGNVTYSGAGVLSPLSNDPNYETIGMALYFSLRYFPKFQNSTLICLRKMIHIGLHFRYLLTRLSAYC